MPPVSAFLTTLGAQAGSNALQFGSQQLSNYFQHKRNLDYYNIQRTDALRDLADQRAYDTPANMVARLKAANLSPYAMTGSSFVASSQQARGTQMAAPPSAYQFGPATNILQMRQGLEQLKGIMLDNEAKKEDITAKKIDNEANVGTKYSKNIAELNLMAAQLEQTNASISEKKQTVDNMKQQLVNLTLAAQASQNELVYQKPFLAGRNQLQQQQITLAQRQASKIIEEISSIKIHNEQDVKMFVFKLNDIQQRIRQLQNDNQSREFQNFYLPETLRQNQQQRQLDIDTKGENLKYLQTLPPELRYAIDKLGDGNAIKALMRTRGLLRR